MAITTPPPRINLLERIPELSTLASITVRLHPRLGAVAELGATKIGGRFFWPTDRPWPHCRQTAPPDWFEGEWPVPDGIQGNQVPLVTVLQLRAVDFPDVKFFPDSDLFQLLWCPLDHAPPMFAAEPFIYWQSESASVGLSDPNPTPAFFQESFIPNPCVLHLERVLELPSVQQLPLVLKERIIDVLMDEFQIDEDEATDLYDAELSVCPGTKVGGWVKWVQQLEIPRCKCGNEMTHLLTLSSTEFDRVNSLRWCASDLIAPWDKTHSERLSVQGAAFSKLGGRQIIFICRQCPRWPIDVVFQR